MNDGAGGVKQTVDFVLPAFTLIAFICLAAGFVWFAAAVAAPAVLRAALAVKPGSEAAGQLSGRVQLRYQDLGAFYWMFARFKLRLDSMFVELPDLLKSTPNVRNILDVGCGYGLAGCAILEWLPQVRIYAIDPDAARVRVAARVFGERGQVAQAGAPDIGVATFPNQFDLVLVLDVIHFVSDDALDLTLRRIRERSSAGGCLVIRAIIPPAGVGSVLWNLERMKQGITGLRAHYRSADQIRRAIERAGLTVSRTKCSGGNPELFWFVAEAPSC